MAMQDTNRFRFRNDGRLRGVTVLEATMTDFAYARHAHEELAIGVTLSGVQEFNCRGSLFRSAPGGIMLFNPGDVHNGNPGNGTVLRYAMLYLDPREFLPLMGCFGAARESGRFREIHFRDRALALRLLRLVRAVKHGGGSTIELEYALYGLAGRLAQRGGLQPGAASGGRDALLARAREYIDDNLSEDVSIDELSNVANMSKFHFIRLFREQFGLTPHQYILNRRVNRARIALEQGRTPSEVAQDYVFFDASHLSRRFKRIYGVTPKQYQLQLRK